MAEGVDYSWTRPGPVCLAAAGKAFVVRYTQPDDRPKSLSYAEAVGLVSAGISMVAVHQPSGNKGWMLEGRARGERAARDALEMAEPCGIDDDRPIYYALDIDPNLLTADQWGAVQACLDGAAAVTGRERVGLYGGWLAIERMVGTGAAAWGWQTYAWSGGRWHAAAQLQQYRNGVSLCGGTVDLDRSTVEDYGQWDDP